MCCKKIVYDYDWVEAITNDNIVHWQKREREEKWYLCRMFVKKKCVCVQGGKSQSGISQFTI